MPTYDYDASQYDPPAPVAMVTLQNPNSQASITNHVLLIDSGADATLLSRTAVESLGLSPLADQRYELIGFDGSRSFAPAAIIDMIFLGRRFRGKYLLIDSESGVLGRDVLNHLRLLLDGPRQQWSHDAP